MPKVGGANKVTNLAKMLSSEVFVDILSEVFRSSSEEAETKNKVKNTIEPTM